MKKMLVTGLAAVVAASCLFVGCQKKDGGTAAANKGGDAAPAAEGKVLNIYVWNEEFQTRVKKYYPGYNEANDTIGDVKVNWVITPNQGNAYQDKLDEVLAQQASAKADDKVDIFLVESDYALKYTDTPYALDVKADLGFTDADLSKQYQYTKDIMTANGKLKGLTWQACPAGVIYRRSIAKALFGTDDPETVQTKISNWSDFDKVAADAKAKGYFMVSGYDDDYRVFSDNVKSPWVVNGKINVDDSIREWVAQQKEYTDKGYNNKAALWSQEQWDGAKKDGKVFCYFGPAWFIDFSLSPQVGDAETGSYGDWAFCKGPQGYSWGGTWICAAAGTDNKTLVKDILAKLTTD
ncbi:MAG: carbohydrate ABC transporter substrate-binding protein, partial [Treponema sp.]|nr:carbohydrate ABC transporter substrate-binding protein [Treponema sp.]